MRQSMARQMKQLPHRSTSIWLWLLFLLVTVRLSAAKPNIVIILADDMGFDDVSFRGSNEFITPHIDALAYSGIILKNLYVSAMCTPSRAALLTGKYPIHTGMQHYVISNNQPWGLPLNETTMAQIFQANGYRTTLLGKWHLGMARRSLTPTQRGFHHHYGYLGAYIDYYDQTLTMFSKNLSRGHDFRYDLVSTRAGVGVYVTDLLTEAAVTQIERHDFRKEPLFMLFNHLAPHSGNDDRPLQAPASEIEKFAYIKDPTRRIYAAMVSVLDKSVGLVIDALHRRGALNDTIIIFLSDNGGPTVGMHATKASNYPLRGQKNSPWEGGIRSSGAIWSTRLGQLGQVSHQDIYIADLLPTLAAAAQLDASTYAHLQWDGLNLWPTLSQDQQFLPFPREILHNWDELSKYVSYMSGRWKVIMGTTNAGNYDTWYGGRVMAKSQLDPRSWHYEKVIRATSVWQQLNAATNRPLKASIAQLRQEAGISCMQAHGMQPCRPLEAPCLFDIALDPCEQNNLYEQYKGTQLFQELIARIEYLKSTAQRPNNLPDDPRSNPLFHNGEWTWWLDDDDQRTL